MDELLKLLAGASMHLQAGEDALGEGAHATASDELDAAGEVLATLRGRWPEMSPAERTLVGRTAAPLRSRLDAAQARLPRRSALSEGAPESDPEEDAEPET
jgi:hypothetical protein